MVTYSMEHEIDGVLHVDSLECMAIWSITAEWEGSHLDYAFNARLLSWWLGDREHYGPELAFQLLGHEEVQRQAAIVHAEWLTTCEDVRRDELYGDRIDATKEDL